MDEGEEEERLKMVERAIHRLIDDEKEKKKKKKKQSCYSNSNSNSNRRKDELCKTAAAAEGEVYFDAAALTDHDSCQLNLVAPAGQGDGTLLIKLLNQLESVKAEPGEHSFSTNPEPDHVPEPELETPTKHVSDEDHTASGNNSKDVLSEEIVKELRIVKRQNRTTHCLLSVLLAATLLWQFSEVSLLFIMKEKVSHPFKSIGSFIKGSLKNAFKRNKTSRSPEDNGPIEVPSLPLPQLSTSLTSDNNE